MTARVIARRPLLPLTVAGAAAFWGTNLLISLTPPAADYRAATHISYAPMLAEALLGGLILSALVSAGVIRLQHHDAVRAPVQTSMLLALAAFVAVSALIELPGKLTTGPDRPWRELAVATAINALRITALGLAIGYAAERARRGPSPTTTGTRPATTDAASAPTPSTTPGTTLPGEPARPHH
jgi:hypothetical protein